MEFFNLNFLERRVGGVFVLCTILSLVFFINLDTVLGQIPYNMKISNPSFELYQTIPTKIPKDEIIGIQATVTNLGDAVINFEYATVIYDKNNAIVYQEWFASILNPGASGNVRFPEWKPDSTGAYTISIEVWDNHLNKKQIAMPITFNIQVLGITQESVIADNKRVYDFGISEHVQLKQKSFSKSLGRLLFTLAEPTREFETITLEIPKRMFVKIDHVFVNNKEISFQVVDDNKRTTVITYHLVKSQIFPTVFEQSDAKISSLLYEQKNNLYTTSSHQEVHNGIYGDPSGELITAEGNIVEYWWDTNDSSIYDRKSLKIEKDWNYNLMVEFSKPQTPALETSFRIDVDKINLQNYENKDLQTERGNSAEIKFPAGTFSRLEPHNINFNIKEMENAPFRPPDNANLQIIVVPEFSDYILIFVIATFFGIISFRLIKKFNLFYSNEIGIVRKF
jgi:hypothetical protein